MAKRGRPPNARSTNGLARQFTGGPAAHGEARRNARKAEELAARRAKAWRLFCDQGLTFIEIGRRLGVSNYTAHSDVMAVKRAMDAILGEDAEVLRARQASNLRSVIHRHLPRRDRVESARVILQALEGERRLFGLEKQRENTFTAEQVVELGRALARDIIAEIPDMVLRLKVLGVFKKRLPAGQVLEAPALPPATGTEGG